MSAEQSNTSLVYDDRLIAKVFRTPARDGPNPDIEVTEALARAGFTHVAQPVAVWRKGGTDLAFVQQFLLGPGGPRAGRWRSPPLRDLYASRPADPLRRGRGFLP